MSVRLIARSVLDNPGNEGARFRHLWRAVMWQLQKRAIGVPREIQLANGVRFRAYPDCVVSSSLIYAEWPEYRELQFLRHILYGGEVMIDVGANVGHISLLLADIVGPNNIFAFEPTPVSFRRLVENWELNGWLTEQLLQAAVGRSEGIARVPDTDRPDTKNSINILGTAHCSVEVPLVALDRYRSRWRGRNIGLLKIDVEGYEREVFAGAIELLHEDRPRMLMFESLAGEVDAEIAAVLEKARYAIFQLNESGRPDFEHRSSQNLFAVPDENRSYIARCVGS